MSDLALVEQNYMPVLSIQAAVARYNAVVEFTQRVMKKDKDYGVIPGTGDKPTLLKPGAEKLCSLFGFAPQFELIASIEDFDKGLFYFKYRCSLFRDGRLMGTGIGSCNSREKKYRYRNLTEKQASADDKARAVRVEEKSGKYGKYKVWVVENTEPFDLVNTLDKMAQKRALIAATLIAANASEFFTQDVEDMDFIDADFHETPAPAQPPAQQASAPAMTIDEAKERKTQKGTRYGDMSREQLEYICEHGKNGDVTAARLILDSWAGDPPMPEEPPA